MKGTIIALSENNYHHLWNISSRKYRFTNQMEMDLEQNNGVHQEYKITWLFQVMVQKLEWFQINCKLQQSQIKLWVNVAG